MYGTVTTILLSALWSVTLIGLCVALVKGARR